MSAMRVLVHSHIMVTRETLSSKSQQSLATSLMHTSKRAWRGVYIGKGDALGLTQVSHTRERAFPCMQPKIHEYLVNGSEFGEVCER